MSNLRQQIRFERRVLIGCLLCLGVVVEAVVTRIVQARNPMAIKATDVLVKWYGDYAAALKQAVLHPTGGSQVSQDYRQARAAQLVQQIEQYRQQLGVSTSLWVGTNVPAAYTAGLKLGTQQAIEAGVVKPNAAGRTAPIAGSFTIVNHRAVEILARDTASDLNKAAGAAAERAKTILRKTAQLGLDETKINKIIGGGIVEGTPRQTVLQLRDELVKVHGETVPVIDKNGDTINFDAKYYAEMVVKTKTREAVVDAQHERLQEVGVDLVSIVGRISQNFCTAFLGQVFSLSGKSDKYPAYATLPSGGPPFHPHCSKSTRPFIDYLASKTQLKLADGLDDSRKLLGMDTSSAQRAYKDLQIHAQVKDHYTGAITKIFGSGPKAA